MKVVLAIDGSDFSKIAIKALTKMPLPNNTEICVLNVYEYPIMMTSGPLTLEGSIGNFYQELITSAEKLGNTTVSNAAKTLKGKNNTLNITTSVISGNPKKEILEKAKTFNADLIVVGSQGQGALSRFLLGSVSQYIASHANCSVLIARDKDEE
ncbi:MAG: universal stress protein [Mesoflavibacter sp.]|nr:universal stress protein [Mesoflavibacter sp.]